MSKVSVILPVYNVEAYIQQTVESVLNQTYQDFELLIVDDGSSDRSIELCQQYRDPRIRILRQQNRGLAGARNTGIRHATGDYVALLDGDDLWLPEKLERHVQHLERSPTVGVSFSRSTFIDEQGKPLGIYQMPRMTDIAPEHVFCRNPIGNGSAVVLRWEVLAAIAFPETWYGKPETFYFDDQFRQSEDIECWLRIVLTTQWRIEGIPEALTLYRVNAGGLSANVLKQLESWERVVEKTRAYAPDFIRQWERRARAYQLRYLARRSVRQRAAGMAVKLVNQAVWTEPRMLLDEPRRTILTLGAAYLSWLLPRRIYTWLETLSMQQVGAKQTQQIQKDQLLHSSS
jgi:glycosyltransferase involved in cell wall biosynthesis